MSSSCVFCRIVAREQPADILHASDTVVAFRDVNPQAPTHIQLVPKEHIESAADLEERHAGMLAELMRAAAHLANAEGIAASGWRLVTNVGLEGGQHIYHLHFHLIGGRQLRWPPG